MPIRFIKSFSLALLFLLGCASSGFRSPKVITKGHPDYPLSAQLERAEGEVLLAVFVNSEGFVEEVEYLASSGREDLDTAAVRFAEGLVFEPASLNGNPLSVWTRLVLRFKLTENYFDENHWYAEVLELQKKIVKESTPKVQERLLNKLYTSYHGLIEHVKKNPGLRINRSICKVVSKDIQDRWHEYWQISPLAFAVLDDFIERYPEKSIIKTVKERLVKEMVDLRYELAVRSSGSSYGDKKRAKLIQAIDKRLQALGVVIPSQT